MAQLVTSLVASTKLITPGPVSTWMGDRLQAEQVSCLPGVFSDGCPSSAQLLLLLLSLLLLKTFLVLTAMAAGPPRTDDDEVYG